MNFDHSIPHDPASTHGRLSGLANIAAAMRSSGRPRSKLLFIETGNAIVTRDYSLFESPVAVDYFTSE
jgi:hypothetical protein